MISANADGIYIHDSSTQASTNTLISGNLLGTYPSGMLARGNTEDGVDVDDAPNTTIGGTVAAARNVIAGLGTVRKSTVAGETGSLIEGNYIGTNAAGTAALANGGAASIQSSSNTIGGTVGGAGNVISGNNAAGIAARRPQRHPVAGNLIGTDASGTAALSQPGDGCRCQTAPATPIGGTTRPATSSRATG